MTVLYSQTITTPLGQMLITASTRGVCLAEFAGTPRMERESRDLERLFQARTEPGGNEHTAQATQELSEYFRGGRQRFTVALDTPGTDFQRQVWTALRDIPYGTTSHYQALAATIGKPAAVRAVAAGMAGSGVRMGIIPVGTGNVLAGNLSIPDDPAHALTVALDRNHRAVDLAWVRVEDATQESDQPAEGGLRLAAHAAGHPEDNREGEAAPASSNEPRADEYACLVVAGMGYDGETMADTDPELKKRIGWIAYVWAGLGAMGVPRMKARLTLRSPAAAAPDPLGIGDQISGSVIREAGDVADEVTEVEARSVMFANAGEMKMLILAPDANLSDGLIDVIAVDAQAGLLGWADVTWKMLGQLIGLRPVNLPVATGTVAFRQAKGASVTSKKAQVCQVDGDAIGVARTMHVRMQAGALDIAVPAERTWLELLPG